MIQLELMKIASATDATIQKKIFRSGTNTLIISDKEMHNIIKIVKSLKESRLLIKCVTVKTIKNEEKEQKGGFSYISC